MNPMKIKNFAIDTGKSKSIVKSALRNFFQEIGTPSSIGKLVSLRLLVRNHPDSCPSVGSEPRINADKR